MSIFSGRTNAVRLNIPDQANSFQIPADIQWVIIKNVGAVDLKLNFDDDSASDYWTLTAGETTGPIMVAGANTVHTDGVGGSTIMEILQWG